MKTTSQFPELCPRSNIVTRTVEKHPLNYNFEKVGSLHIQIEWEGFSRKLENIKYNSDTNDIL